MSSIHVLDENTINKIAAGEVVERPSSVVKELMENSIDAGASKIDVEIMAGGTSFIRITDNGRAMTREDVQVAILRHATSKITAVGDLEKIATLGFRGEALPSIAAVSRFSILTRRAQDELGTSVKIIGGKLEDIGEAGCGIGTTIKVEDLFFNTPARKKFLKTTSTETNKINDYVIKLAFSNPQIAVKLISNNKITVITPGTGSLKDTITGIYGRTVGQELLTLGFNDEDVKITGYISKPAVIRSSRTWQTFIVNGRIITSRMISRAIDNAYHSLLPKSGYPLAVLNIEVAKNTIDINVHPQKIELKFADEGRLFKAVYKTILDAVRPAQSDDAKTLDAFAAPADFIRPRYEEPMLHSVSAPNSETPETSSALMIHETNHSGGLHSEDTSFLREADADDFKMAKEQIYAMKNTAVISQNMQNENILADTQTDPQLSAARELFPLGQIDLCYIIAQGEDGMYIIDQHAAHERILYDRFGLAKDRIVSQQLLVHLLLNLSSAEYDLLEENREILYKLGFNAESSGPQQFRLMEIPADIPMDEAENTIRDILASLNEMHTPTPQEIRHACLATAACRAAIKAGDKLTLQQMKIILDELAHTRLPYTCPHGRPTTIKFEHRDLAKMFKRIQ
ncbi:DNA mismatch repair endonuclease MutL [Pectinatus haikarae]|uniref:DNA mismatch repair protein MutL n=1 Tax=Pectinatus haikarae TaxID=349096 RepID=A0ABT9Y8C6_9FIRM|nr:DNA mismatch repair endonuclease MutL [Pectinatus haikarae]MDQ0203399.1 DNA mismatch repair protein MutL [Pectinatus haikarae]